MWVLTLNRYKKGAQNPFDILWCFINGDDDRLSPYWDLYQSWYNASYLVPSGTTTVTTPVLTANESCQIQYWSNAMAWDPWKCKCKSWYKRNTAWTACVAMTEWEKCQLEFWANATEWDSIWYCRCKAWYKRNSAWTACIVMTEDEKCHLDFWNNSYSPEPGYCACISWYQRSSDWKSCVKTPTSYTTTINGKTYTTTPANVNGLLSNTSTNIINSLTYTWTNCSIFWPNAHYKNASCECKDGYEWNYNRNWCVATRNHPSYNGTDFRSAKDGTDYAKMLLDFDSTVDSTESSTESSSSVPEKVLKAKQELWDKAAIFEGLVPIFLEKDKQTQENVKTLLKSFEWSKDQYTKNIWIYFGYLVD